MPANAFDPEFLASLGEHDAPDSADEASTAGPWRVEPAGPGRWSVLQDGEAEPAAVFGDRELALLAAALFPARGRGPLYLLGDDADGRGFPVQTLRGEHGLVTVGWLAHFDQDLVSALL